MQPSEAAKLLELPADATPDQVEARFNELRAKLEDRIAKAPTPGLKAKYRETLEEVTTAFETLAIAADSSSLPVLKKEAGGGRREAGNPSAGGAANPLRGSESDNPKSRIENRKPGKELLVVAIIAVAVLGAGGWFVLKTRAGNAEQARIAAEAKAEMERKAMEEKRLTEEARLAALAQRQQAEAEQAKQAAAERAETERREKLGLSLRTQLAEARVKWQSFEAQARSAERKASEARADLRALREAGPELRTEMEARAHAADAFASWASEQLARHPVRLSLVRLESLLSSRDPEPAAQEADTLRAALDRLDQDIAAAERDLLSVTGDLQLTAGPAPFQWELRDAFGRTQRGQTPATVTDVAVGPVQVRFTRDGWPAFDRTAEIRRSRTNVLGLDLPTGRITLATTPANIPWKLRDALDREFAGLTPARLEEVSAGRAVLQLARGDWPPLERAIEVRAGETHDLNLALPTGSLQVTSEPSGAEVRVGEKTLGRTPLLLREAPAGPVELGLYLADHHPGKVGGEVPAGGETTLRGALVSSLSEADYPVVYLCRPKRTIGMIVKVKVSVNDQQVVALGNGDYHVIRLRPGTYRFTVDPPALGAKTVTKELKVEARQSYYMLGGPVASGFSSSALLEFVSALEGQAALVGLEGSPQPVFIDLSPE